MESAVGVGKPPLPPIWRYRGGPSRGGWCGEGGRTTKAGRYRKGCAQVAARFGTSPTPSAGGTASARSDRLAAVSALPRCCCSLRPRSQAQVGTERQRTRAKLGNEVGRRRQAVATATASSSAPGGRHLDPAGQPVQALIEHIAAALAHHACAGRCGSRWSLGPSQWMRLGGVVRTLRPAAALTDATRT